MDIRYVICVLHQKQKCQVLAITYLAFLQSGSATILKYFTGDLVSRVLKVHDGIRDLDSDGIDDGLNIKRPCQSVSQLPEIICKIRVLLLPRFLHFENFSPTTLVFIGRASSFLNIACSRKLHQSGKGVKTSHFYD